MEEKLRILMKNENLTASRLAEILEVQPAVISHLLRGRNKPSFELVCKLVNRFPQINPYWLLGDSEEIYTVAKGVSTEQAPTTSSSPIGGTLFDLANENSEKSEKSNILPSVNALSEAARPASDIERILIIYKDKSFEELFRRK